MFRHENVRQKLWRFFYLTTPNTWSPCLGPKFHFVQEGLVIFLLLWKLKIGLKFSDICGRSCGMGAFDQMRTSALYESFGKIGGYLTVI